MSERERERGGGERERERENLTTWSHQGEVWSVHAGVRAFGSINSHRTLIELDPHQRVSIRGGVGRQDPFPQSPNEIAMDITSLLLPTDMGTSNNPSLPISTKAPTTRQTSSWQTEKSQEILLTSGERLPLDEFLSVSAPEDLNKTKRAQSYEIILTSGEDCPLIWSLFCLREALPEDDG